MARRAPTSVRRDRSTARDIGAASTSQDPAGAFRRLGRPERWSGLDPSGKSIPRHRSIKEIFYAPLPTTGEAPGSRHAREAKRTGWVRGQLAGHSRPFSKRRARIRHGPTKGARNLNSIQARAYEAQGASFEYPLAGSFGESVVMPSTLETVIRRSQPPPSFALGVLSPQRMAGESPYVVPGDVRNGTPVPSRAWLNFQTWVGRPPPRRVGQLV
jgi:hypothetical protein